MKRKIKKSIHSGEAVKENAGRNKKKIGKILGIIGIALVAVIAVYTVLVLFGNSIFHQAFFAKAETGSEIPGLTDGFTPQGVTTLEGSDETLICGYMPGSENSRIYRVSADGTVTEIRLLLEDGTAYTGHAGGFTAAGQYIYISNASKLFVLNTADVLNATDGGTVQFVGRIEVPCRASFCSSDGEMLYVGEYHAVGYTTEESHKVDSKDGILAAMVFAYRLSEDGIFGIADTEIPEKIFATCDNVQGFAMLPGETAMLSCSAGIASSSLRFYQAGGSADSIFPYKGKSVPLFVLDSDREIRTEKAPHMSEDLEYRNGKVYIGFEAGAQKFGGGLLPCTVKNVMMLQIE